MHAFCRVNPQSTPAFTCGRVPNKAGAMRQPLHLSTRRFASVLATSTAKPPVCPRLFATTPISRGEHPENLFATRSSHRLFTSTTTKMSPAPSATIQFYTGGSLDPSSPSDTLEKILTTWSDRTLEARHDYIQHLFPLPERSPVNPDAPVLTNEVRHAFLDTGSQGAALREGLQKAFGRMSRFYGFVLDEGQVSYSEFYMAACCIRKPLILVIPPI